MRKLLGIKLPMPIPGTQTQPTLPTCLHLTGAGGRKFELSTRQAKMLVNNLPTPAMASLVKKGWFEVQDGLATLRFSLIGVGRIRFQVLPKVEIRQKKVFYLNFSFDGQDDPIMAFALLYLMWRRCPKAFYLMPCNHYDYWHTVFSPEERQRFQQLGSLTRDYYSLLKYFEERG